MSEFFTYAREKSAVDSTAVRLSHGAQKNETRSEREMKSTVRALVACTIFAGPLTAGAVSFSDTNPEYSGPYNTIGFPIDLGVVGTFTFGGPYSSVTSASVSGSWGNSANSTSAAGRVYVDDILVATCVTSAACVSGAIDAWSYMFTAADLSTGFLNDGIANIRVIQDSPYIIRLGAFALRGEGVPVPEPGTLALLGLGLAGLGLSRRRKAN